MDTTIQGLFYFFSFRWGKAQCINRPGNEDESITGKVIREKLGGILYLIRFPLMSSQDYGKVVRPSGLLNDQEFLMVFDYLILSDEDR